MPTPKPKKTYNWKDIAAQYADGTIVGVRPDPRHAADFARRNPTPTYAVAAWETMELPDRDTFLYRLYNRALTKKFGKSYKWQPQAQRFGTCTGQGTKIAQEIVAAIISELYRLPFPGRFSVGTNYGGARVEIARQAGKWEGAAVSWLADWSVKFGCVRLSALNLPEDDKDADEDLGMKWAAATSGVPTELERVAKETPILNCPSVRTPRETAKAVQNGNSVIIGSVLIPDGKRDSRGFSKVKKTGGHCVAITAVRYNPLGFLYQNSWSEQWGSGPTWPDDQPPGSVWVDESGMAGILSENECYALAGIGGLRPRHYELLPEGDRAMLALYGYEDDRNMADMQAAISALS